MVENPTSLFLILRTVLVLLLSNGPLLMSRTDTSVRYVHQEVNEEVEGGP